MIFCFKVLSVRIKQSNVNLIPLVLIEAHLTQNLKFLPTKKKLQKRSSLPPSYFKFQSTEGTTVLHEHLALE